MGDEVDVDVPRPVGDDYDEGQDEEEDKEVGGLGVAAVQETHHGDEEDYSESDVQISRNMKVRNFICLNTLDNESASLLYFQCNITLGRATLVVLVKLPLEIALLQPTLLKILFFRKIIPGISHSMLRKGC